jgi:DNA-binding response OmpR family regulator
MQIAERTNLQPGTTLDTVIVLCADDAVRDAIGYWLSSPPVRARVAADGYEANRILKETPCRLFVTDRILPPWPGLDTFLQLRAAYPDLKIAFIDDGSPDSRSLARVTGAHVVLPRPLTRQSVLAAVPQTAKGN